MSGLDGAGFIAEKQAQQVRSQSKILPHLSQTFVNIPLLYVDAAQMHPDAFAAYDMWGGGGATQNDMPR